MPELPEVEVTRRSLTEQMVDAVVHEARLGKSLRWPLGCTEASLAGRVVGALQRRGKYLWMPLSARPMAAVTEDAGGLLLHLGMSGSLAFGRDLVPAGAHDHFELTTSRGTLRLTDPRRFGAVIWSSGPGDARAAKLLSALGYEPFDPSFDGPQFHRLLKVRRAPIKAVLLAGQVIVGVGNIYASEVLFRAGIDPRLRSNRISQARAHRLLAAIRQTLERAIALGGSTLRDFRDAYGSAGAFQAEALVYGRAGLPCPNCGAPIRRLEQGQRATYFCARCQRR